MDKCPYCGAHGNKNMRNCWFCGKELPQDEPPSLFRGGTESKRKLEESSSADDSIPELKVCPHCGEKSLFYNFVSGEWECLNKGCESHKKASESAKLKEGKSAKAKRRASSGGGRAWFGNLYYDAKSRKWRNPARGGLPMRKFLLFILLLASLATIPYGGYLLYEHRIGLITGGVLLLADVAVLIWLASLLRRYRVPFGSFIAVLILTGLVCSAACAYGDVEPFAKVKDRITGFLTSQVANVLKYKIPPRAWRVPSLLRQPPLLLLNIQLPLPFPLLLQRQFFLRRLLPLKLLLPSYQLLRLSQAPFPSFLQP